MAVADPSPRVTWAAVVALRTPADGGQISVSLLEAPDPELLLQGLDETKLGISWGEVVTYLEKIRVALLNGSPKPAGARLVVPQAVPHGDEGPPPHDIVAGAQQLLIEADGGQGSVLPLAMGPGTPSGPEALRGEERLQGSV